MNEYDKVDAIIAEQADADMSADELFELLIQNDVSPTLVREVAEDMRS